VAIVDGDSVDGFSVVKISEKLHGLELEADGRSVVRVGGGRVAGVDGGSGMGLVVATVSGMIDGLDVGKVNVGAGVVGGDGGSEVGSCGRMVATVVGLSGTTLSVVIEFGEEVETISGLEG